MTMIRAIFPPQQVRWCSRRSNSAQGRVLQVQHNHTAFGRVNAPPSSFIYKWKRHSALSVASRKIQTSKEHPEEVWGLSSLIVAIPNRVLFSCCFVFGVRAPQHPCSSSHTALGFAPTYSASSARFRFARVPFTFLSAIAKTPGAWTLTNFLNSSKLEMIFC